MFKAKKIVFAIVLIAIMIFSLCMPVSAESADCTIQGNTNIGGFDLYYAGVELIKPDNKSYSGGVVYCNPLSSTKTRVQINSFGDGSTSLADGSTVGVTLFFDPLNTQFKDKNLSCTGSFTIGFRKDMCDVTSFYINRTGSDGSGGLAIQYPTLKDITKSDENFIYYRVTFDEKTFDSIYDQYIIHIVYDVKGYGDSYAKYLYLFDFDFKTVSKEDYQLNAIDNSIDKNTDKITENQDKNTQAIIDNQNQLQENEKNEIQNSGDQATESADDVPNQSDGFINAFGKLVNVMSYNGIECKWTVPDVKMPRVGKIIPEMTLIESQEIDFGFWVQKMPSRILDLVRAILTSALIVYCFKELYGTISYVFTLKGGGE